MKIIHSIYKLSYFILYEIWNIIILKCKSIKYGSNLKINGRLMVHGNGKINIGNNVTINSLARFNPTSGFDKTHLSAMNNAAIYIGNNCGISHANITAFKQINIDDDVMIGSGVKIWDTDFHSITYEYRMEIPDTHIVSKPIHIKKGAFIGACSIILKGVTVGEKSIVGAGSVVTKDIPDGEIWAGNPAQFIRTCE